jgi:transposase
LTTKLHASVDAKGRVVRLRLTAGQSGDAPQALPLLEGYKRGEVGCVIADAAYDGNEIRQRVRSLRARTCIKPNPTRKVQKRYDRKRYKHRNLVERFFGAIKRFRRVATRYEKKAENYLGFVWLAAALTGMN